VTLRRLAGVAGVLLGSAGVAACLRSASAGMRDVMQADGGSCASGGPYVIARQCSGGDMRLLMAGILGGLLCTAVLVVATAGLGLSGARAGLLAWSGLFGVLGWNFISLGLHPAGSGSPGPASSSGWLVSGGVFWLLAVGGLVPLLSGIIGDLRLAGRPDPLMTSAQPLVRAAFVPGVSVPQPGPPLGWPAGTPGKPADQRRLAGRPRGGGRGRLCRRRAGTGDSAALTPGRRGRAVAGPGPASLLARAVAVSGAASHRGAGPNRPRTQPRQVAGQRWQ
jgi:hypothetical protein